MSNERAAALQALIAYQLPIEPVLGTLSSLGWDQQEPLVALSPEAFASVLERCLAGELSLEQLTDWADLIECREDIEVPAEPQDLSHLVFRLANPNLEGAVTKELVGELRDKLRQFLGERSGR
jgi:hypothetical protein